MIHGWIKIHRKITENSFCAGNSERLGFWILLLTLASHKDNTFFVGYKKISCVSGQFVTGRKKLALKSGVSEMKVERWLSMLESEQQIEQQKTSKYRLITVKKWSEYQNDEQENEQQMNNKRTTDEQQTNTIKNVKNDKNVKNKHIAASNESAETDNTINKVFSAFYEFNEGINFGNKTSRDASDWLIKHYGLERVLNVIKFVAKIRGRPYAPRISTPYQLKEKWADLETFALTEKEKQETKKFTIGSITPST